MKDINFADALYILLVLSLVVQFLTDRIKAILPWEKIGTVKLIPIYSLIVAQVVAWVTQVDFFALFQLPTQATVGIIVTGLATSGGAAGIHELISKLRESRITNQDGTTPE